MSDKSQLKKFISFLKKENIYEIYLRNLTFDSEYRQRWAMVKEKDMVIWLTKTVKLYPHRLIVDAFRWNSWEGVNWILISEKWEKIIDCTHHVRYI
jgi:hypothetical protein